MQYLQQIEAYIHKMLPYLEESTNVWLIQHPQIITRLKSWDWKTDFITIENRLTELYNNIEIEKPIGTLAITWDDYEYSGVTIYFASTNEYSEWIDDDWLDYELNLDFITHSIFSDINNWIEELGHQLPLFQNLFLGMVELAVIKNSNNRAFKALKIKNEYLILSSSFHDTEYDVIHDTTNLNQLHEIYFPEDASPINTEVMQIDENSYFLFDQKYTLETKWFRSNESRLGNIPKEIALFKNLEEADFHNEYIQILPDELFQLLKLTKLDLSKNQLENIDYQFEQLIQLKKLNLSNNKLSSLPLNLSKLSKLEQLDLDNNQLKKLPENFTELITLKNLSLVNNQLKELPDLPQNIIWLNLLNNQLSALPFTFNKLKKLKTLVISDNLFTRVPKEIFELEALESIELGGNYLEDLPERLLKMPNLKEIRIYPNPFSVEKRKELKALFGDLIFLGYDTLIKNRL